MLSKNGPITHITLWRLFRFDLESWYHHTSKIRKCQSQCQLSLSKICQSKNRRMQKQGVKPWHKNHVLLVCFRVVMRCTAWSLEVTLGEQRRRLVLVCAGWPVRSLQRRHQVGLFTRAMWPHHGLRGAACSGVIQLVGPRRPPHSLAAQLTARVCCRPSSPSRPHRLWSRATTTSTEMVSVPAEVLAHRTATWCLFSREGDALWNAPQPTSRHFDHCFN